MEIDDYLKVMVKHDASDLYITVGAPPAAKFQGQLKAITKEPISLDQAWYLANSVMNDKQKEELARDLEMNLAIARKNVGRFRVNIFIQRSNVAMVIRNIKTDIPSIRELQLPEVLKDLVMSKRGIILFVGATGSGKSTSLASIIDHRNANSAGHIITIEDPIEFIHKHKKSIINQREVGVDTKSYTEALKNTLRQAPDVILVGEVRDAETMEHALAFAETGHLCLSTLHANNANQAIDRIINFFPEDRHNQILLDLSLNLRAFVSQRLVATTDGKRAAAIEILTGTPMACDLIKRGEVHELKELMEKSGNLGMQTFDMALYDLYNEGRISLDEALRNADSANNLRLKIQLGQKGEFEAKELDVSMTGENSEEAEDSNPALTIGEEAPPAGEGGGEGFSLSLEDVDEVDDDDFFK
ncbi:MAG: PilT/PilU family type 4a pilus ATPase [Gammaproteobacteria bacterium]|nr:MAG: PilT/PilU family type 4a pilus ATPase [Gammaproteobacteria bacterium]